MSALAFAPCVPQDEQDKTLNCFKDYTRRLPYYQLVLKASHQGKLHRSLHCKEALALQTNTITMFNTPVQGSVLHSPLRPDDVGLRSLVTEHLGQVADER